MPKAVRGLVMACHPGPVVVVTIVTAVLAASVGYPPARLGLLASAMLADQFSVGWSNDAIDAERDLAVARADKPIAAGLISRRTVLIAGVTALAVAVALTIPLGVAAVLVHSIALLSAWSYNLWLKRSVLSVLPYLVSFGLLPAIVTLGAVPPTLPASWVVAAGCLLGAAAHVTNVLPDLDADRRTGVRGFAHRLGARTGGLVAFGVLAAGGVVIAGGAIGAAGLRGVPAALVAAGSVATVLIAVVGAILVRSGTRSRLLMRLIMAAALIDVIALVAAGPVLSA